MSQKDAKEFKKYVTEKVLPGMRKNGTVMELWSGTEKNPFPMFETRQCKNSKSAM